MGIKEYVSKKKEQFAKYKQEQARIEKARSAGRPKPQQSSGSGNILGGFAGSGSSDLGMGSMFGQPSKKAPDPFDLGMGGMFGSPAPKPKAKAKKHHKRKR